MVLLTNSLYYLCPYFYIRMFGIKQKGIVIGYKERKYYTKDKPRRLRIVFYPRISYKINNTNVENIISTVKNPEEKRYCADEEIDIIVNKHNYKQSVILGDFRLIIRLITFFIGILYLYIMIVLSKNITDQIAVADIVTNIMISVLLVIVIFRIPLFIVKGCFDNKTAKKYCFQNLFIYSLIITICFAGSITAAVV